MDHTLSYFRGKRILVTGASGYIATNLIHSLKDFKCTIMRLSNNSKLSPINGKANVLDIIGDVCTRDILEKVIETVDIIYHLAAQTSVYVADENPLADLEINVIPILNILEICRNRGWKPVIIFSGTVTQVGIPKTLPVNESQIDCPITIYDLHKKMAENYLKYYSNHRIVQGTILRLANVYGPGPKSSSADRGILNKMVLKAINGEPLTLYGKGNYIRDYIYVEDVVSAFIKAAEHIEELNARHFIIGSGVGYTMADAFNLVIERVAIKTGRRVDLIHVDPPHVQGPIETRSFVADTTSFCNITGWKANYTLSSGLDVTIDSLYNH